MQEVSGSIPLSSTSRPLKTLPAPLPNGSMLFRPPVALSGQRNLLEETGGS